MLQGKFNTPFWTNLTLQLKRITLTCFSVFIQHTYVKTTCLVILINMLNITC